jgi:hypothetical protein
MGSRRRRTLSTFVCWGEEEEEEGSKKELDNGIIHTQSPSRVETSL